MRDKQIEEMAKDLENHTCMSEYQAEIASRMLYIKGYRKASDVARKIFEDIRELTELSSLYGKVIIDVDKLAELQKKYESEGI